MKLHLSPLGWNKNNSVVCVCLFVCCSSSPFILGIDATFHHLLYPDSSQWTREGRKGWDHRKSSHPVRNLSFVFLFSTPWTPMINALTVCYLTSAHNQLISTVPSLNTYLWTNSPLIFYYYNWNTIYYLHLLKKKLNLKKSCFEFFEGQTAEKRLYCRNAFV